MLNVAVVGAGRMGRTRALAAQELGATVLAICDSERERADALANSIGGAAVFTDCCQMPWDQLDAVFICTPPVARHEFALGAAKASVHMFMEKPIGLSANDGMVLLSALEGSGLVTAVGYMNRYRESVQRVRKAIQDQRILGVVANWVGGRYGVPWWADSAQSGGPLNEQSTHVIDLCRYLVGEIKCVQSMLSSSGDARLAESAVLSLRFASGALGSFFYSCQAQEKMISFRILTDQQEYRLEGWEFELTGDRVKATDNHSIFMKETKAFFGRILQADGARARQITDNSGAPVLSDLRDAIQTQRVVDSILNAAECVNTQVDI